MAPRSLPSVIITVILSKLPLQVLILLLIFGLFMLQVLISVCSLALVLVSIIDVVTSIDLSDYVLNDIPWPDHAFFEEWTWKQWGVLVAAGFCESP